MTVKNINEAWAKVSEIFPTDYNEDVAASERVGYKIYRSSINHYDYICDLGDRLEVNLADGITINIWVEAEEVEEVKAIEEAEAESEAEAKQKMKRIIDVDMTINAKKVKTAFNRFFKKYPSLEYWRDTFEYMANNNEDFFSDDIMADGTKNNNWRYALHLDIEDGYIYMAVIERAEAQ